jgi:hypothetical protein
LFPVPVQLLFVILPLPEPEPGGPPEEIPEEPQLSQLLIQQWVQVRGSPYTNIYRYKREAT